MGIFHIFLTLTQTETQRHDRAPLIIWILKRNYFGPPRARRARPTATIPLPTTNITNYNTYLYVFVYYCGVFGPLLLYVDYVHNKLQVYTISNQIWYCRYLSPGIYYLLEEEEEEEDDQDYPIYNVFWYFISTDPNRLRYFCCFGSRSEGKILTLVKNLSFPIQKPLKLFIIFNRYV